MSRVEEQPLESTELDQVRQLLEKAQSENELLHEHGRAIRAQLSAVNARLTAIETSTSWRFMRRVHRLVWWSIGVYRRLSTIAVTLYRRVANVVRSTGHVQATNTAPRADLDRYRGGISGDLDSWLDFNRTGAFESPESLALVAAFPPPELMRIVSGGLANPKDFAAHGCDFLLALSKASPVPMRSYADVLDFGVGVGRLARMFKGTKGQFTGVDVDKRNVEWVSSALDYVTGIVTTPRQPLPFADKRFDCVISISVFTHMNEQDQFFYLSEIARVTQPGAMIFLTVHGERALERAETEAQIFAMLDVPRSAIDATRQLFPQPGFSFILQHGHLTSRNYDYGITFTARDYIEREWSKYFEVISVCPGAIHDFQSIIVLKTR